MYRYGDGNWVSTGASQAEQTPLIGLSGIRREGAAGTALVGANVELPLVSGGVRRYVNLDYAASAPCLVAVKQAVDELLPWYSSVPVVPVSSHS